MICHGDELGRTQSGNNNGYCQDNELTWIEWADADTALLEFTRVVSALRSNHPVFRRHRFFNGKPVGRRGQDGLPDIAWFAPDGTEMTDDDWGAGFSKSVAVFLNGHGIPGRDARGQRVLDDSFLLCFNAHYEPIDFNLPPADFGANWRVVVHTGAEDAEHVEELGATAELTVDAHTAVVLQAVPAE
jgi:glycogen operon protein